MISFRRTGSPLLLLLLVVSPARSDGQSARPQQQAVTQDGHRLTTGLAFLAGAATGLAAHEGGHVLFAGVFDADPGVRRVEYLGIPFFAISHRSDVSARQELVISSAGFWVQYAGNEWLLTKRPRLRAERAPFLKGIFAFNVGASLVYSGAAVAKAGPPERDTRGMAVASGLDERWIAGLVLAPAVFDLWRYYDAGARLPVWLSRAAKIGTVLLVLK